MKIKILTTTLFIIVYLSNNANAQRNLITPYILSELNKGQASYNETINERSVIQKNDSIYTWQWDTISNDWKKFKKINIVYDTNNNPVSYIEQFYNISNWQNYQKHINFFDSNNNLTNITTQRWYNSKWENDSQFIITYDANKNLTSKITRKYRNDDWVYIKKLNFTFNSKNNTTKILAQSWSGNVWVDYGKDTFTYDTNNNLLCIFGQDKTWNSSKWFNSYIDSFTYDTKNNLISQKDYEWDGAWYCSYIISYTYNTNGKRIGKLIKDWNNTSWSDVFNYIYVYDGYNNLTSCTYFFWYNNTWIKEFEEYFTYDLNNFVLSDSYKYLNSIEHKISEGDSIRYYFHTYVGINDLIVQENHIIVYPNPNNGKFAIKSNNEINSIEIYNLTGKLVYSNFNINKQTSNEIDFTSLQKGIYFARINDGKQVFTKKLVIQ